MVKAAFMFTPADIHSGPHTVQPLKAPFMPLCLAFSGSIRFVRACLGQVCPAPSNMAQDEESFAELVARLSVAGPEPDMEAMENTGTSPVATDAAEEDKAAKAEEEMADATETEVAPAKKSQEESWPEQEKGQEESRPEQEEGWVWKEGQWAWCMGRQEWAWLKSQWVWLEEQVAWAQPQWVWPSGAGDWVWRDAMWVQLQAPEDKPYPTERGWQPHAGMIMPQEWQGQWFVPPSPASGEEEDPSSQAVQDEVMEDYGSEEGKAKSFLEVLRMQEEAEEEERAAKRQKFTEKSTGSNPQKPNANQIYPQDLFAPHVRISETAMHVFARPAQPLFCRLLAILPNREQSTRSNPLDFIHTDLSHLLVATLGMILMCWTTLCIAVRCVLAWQEASSNDFF